MTDEATMTVAADAAPTPADTQPQEDTSQPSGNESRTDPTPRSAIDKAFAALEARDRGDKPAADTDIDQAGTRERNPDGTFKAKVDDATAKPVVDTKQPVKPDAPTDPTKTTTNFNDAPARFSADAKAQWATAPEAVRAEATRAIKELEGGIEQYRQTFEPYREFDKQLKTNGQTFKEVFDHYTGIEAMLAKDPLGGLERICQNMGLSLRQVASHVMGQPADQQATQQEGVIRELRNQIANLEKQIGGVSTTIQSEREQKTLDQVVAFASDPAHARFDELSNDIAFFIQNGRAKDLKEAYDLAERLNPAPQPAAPAPAAPAAQTADPAHTRKGQLSTTGAPSSGSNPANRKPPASARDAIDRAFANVGI